MKKSVLSTVSCLALLAGLLVSDAHAQVETANTEPCPRCSTPGSFDNRLTAEKALEKWKEGRVPTREELLYLPATEPGNDKGKFLLIADLKTQVYRNAVSSGLISGDVGDKFDPNKDSNKGSLIFAEKLRSEAYPEQGYALVVINSTTQPGQVPEVILKESEGACVSFWGYKGDRIDQTWGVDYRCRIGKDDSGKDGWLYCTETLVSDRSGSLPSLDGKLMSVKIYRRAFK